MSFVSLPCFFNLLKLGDFDSYGALRLPHHAPFSEITFFAQKADWIVPAIYKIMMKGNLPVGNF